MSYADYGGFGASYFEGNASSSPHDAGYSDYRRGLLPVGDFAQKIRDELEAAGQNINQTECLIVGCALGFTVESLVNDHGIDAWGMDISQYAVDNAPSGIADRILQGDILSSNDLRNVRQTKGQGRFSVVMTNGVLVCLTDTEAQTAGSNVRSEAQDTAMWAVYDSGFGINETWYNSKTMDQWRTLVDPNDDDVWFSRTEFY